MAYIFLQQISLKVFERTLNTLLYIQRFYAQGDSIFIRRAVRIFFFLMNDEQKKMIADSFTRFPVYPKTSLIKYLD